MGYEAVEPDRDVPGPVRTAPTAQPEPVRRSLVVGPANDPAEADADRIADDVVRHLAAVRTRASPIAPDQATRIRRSPTATRTAAGSVDDSADTGTRVGDRDVRIQRMTPRPAVGSDRRNVIRRDNTTATATPPSFTVIRRADHLQVLDAMVPTASLGAAFDKKTSKLSSELSTAFGVKGMSYFRSDAAKAWRQGLKDQARQQGRDDVHEAVEADTTIQYDTERAYYEIQAKRLIYSAAKGSIEKVLADSVRDLVTAAWDGQKQAVIGGAANKAKDAAWTIMRSDPTSKKLIKQARAAAQTTAMKVLSDSYAQAKTDAHNVKRKIVNGQASAVVAPTSMDDLGGAVKQQVTRDDLGAKALKKTIEADSVESGIGIFGKMLDQVVASSGDQIGLSVEVRVPIMEGPGYVSFTLSGKAARGIDGAMTAGVPIFGDPRRLEVMVDLAFKVGADLIGFDINAGLNFFVRAGGDDTALCMKSLSYGAYRTVGAVNHKAANWWAGATEGVEEGRAQRAEAWAAMLEEQAFKNGGGYVDVGAGLGGSMAANFGGDVASAALSGGVGAFWRYDKQALEESLGSVDYTDELGAAHRGEDMFAKRVESKEAAKARRANVRGRGGGAFNASLTIGAKIAGQSVTFAGSVSVPIGAPGWGIEVSGTLGYSGGPDTTIIEKWGAGCATAIADLVKSLIELRKAKAGAALNGAAAATQIVNAGLSNAITDGLAKAWEVEGSQASMDLFSSGTPDAVAGLGTSSTLQVALILGHDGDAVIARIEIRSGRKLEVNATLGGAGVKVSAEKSSRIFAAGYDKGGWDAEAFGIRARGRKDQVDKGGQRGKHRT